MDTSYAERTRSLLTEHRSGGEYLLHSARMVGDEEDHAIWRRGRQAWSESTAEMLTEAFPEARPRFLRPDVSPLQGSDWKRAYEAELRTVHANLVLLESLGETAESSDEEMVHCVRTPACGDQR